jgi:hypothetical protein
LIYRYPELESSSDSAERMHCLQNTETKLLFTIRMTAVDQYMLTLYSYLW